jgi:hypothetical protein
MNKEIKKEFKEYIWSWIALSSRDLNKAEILNCFNSAFKEFYEKEKEMI